MTEQKTKCGCFDDGYEGIQYCLLHQAAPLMIEALQEIEWGPDLERRRFCISCRAFREHGHKSDCKLNAAIKAATSETSE